MAKGYLIAHIKIHDKDGFEEFQGLLESLQALSYPLLEQLCRDWFAVKSLLCCLLFELETASP